MSQPDEGVLLFWEFPPFSLCTYMVSWWMSWRVQIKFQRCCWTPMSNLCHTFLFPIIRKFPSGRQLFNCLLFFPKGNPSVGGADFSLPPLPPGSVGPVLTFSLLEWESGVGYMVIQVPAYTLFPLENSHFFTAVLLERQHFISHTKLMRSQKNYGRSSSSSGKSTPIAICFFPHFREKIVTWPFIPLIVNYTCSAMECPNCEGNALVTVLNFFSIFCDFK